MTQDHPSNGMEPLFSDIVAACPMAVLLFDSDFRVIFANRHAEHLFSGLRQNTLIGHPVEALLAPEDAPVFRDTVDRLRQGESISPFILSLETGSVMRKVAEVMLAPAGAFDRRLTVVYLRDLSLHKKAEEEKLTIERQLRAVYKMEALGQLARGIAHDLNNNLGAIAGYSELIKQIAGVSNDKVARYADHISTAAARSAQVIQKVLTFARKNKMQISSFNANEIIEDTVNLINPSIDKNIRITMECTAPHAVVTGDPEQIQNAILNLALNARDAMPQGGTLTLKTENIFVDEAFAASRSFKMTTGYYLLVSVSDTGCGMPPEIQSHLFEPFFTTKEAGRGTGLGLASVFGSVKSHHGYIEVKSDENEGSSFILYLPVNKSAAVSDDDRSEQDANVTAPSPKAHILVIDDEQSIAEMLMELLSWLNYSATIFTDVGQALDFYKMHQSGIDLAIIDMNMPGIDGLECFDRLRAINPRIKAMISTGYCLEDERDRMVKQGICGVLSKPFVSADLAKAVAEALAS